MVVTMGVTSRAAPVMNNMATARGRIKALSNRV